MNDFLTALRGDEGALPHNSDGLAEQVLIAIRAGRLRSGMRLPTVQEVARDLGVSTSTVSRAWSSLKQMGVIQTRRRGGTTVTRPSDPTAFRNKGQDQSGIRYRLAAGYPDPDLTIHMPDLLRTVSEQYDFPGYLGKDAIRGDLFDAVAQLAGYRPEMMLLASDVIGTLQYVLRAVSYRGAKVGVSEPEFPLYIAVLRQLGLSPLRVRFDENGYSITDIEHLLKTGVKTLLVQARVQTPTGVKVPPENCAMIADLLETHDAIAVEVDHHGALVPRATTLASIAPSRVILMSSFAKSLHPDIRVAILSGPERVLTQISAWRAGGAWVSGVNKALLDAALLDPATETLIHKARGEYARRREIFRSVFCGAGRTIGPGTGLHMWVPVDNEQGALVYLASKGISVAAGSAFHERSSEQDHVYLSLGLIGSDPTHFAQALLAGASYSLEDPLNPANRDSRQS